MYAGAINSPQTTLDGTHTDAVETITVVSTSVFPTAPNIATIGNSASSETILYTGKTGTTLTGVTRGWEGDAAEWADGAVISRNFTQYDHAQFVANIGTLNTYKAEKASATFTGTTSFSDGNITNVGDIALDSISADGTDINIAVTDNSATALTIKQGSDAYLIIDTANSSESVSIGTGVSGTAISIGHSASEVTFGDNVVITGDLTINGATTTNATTNLTVTDPLVKYGQGYTGSAYDQGFVITRGDGSSSNTQNRAFIWDESEDEFAVISAATEDGATAGNVTVTDYVDLHVGRLTAADGVTGTITGEADTVVTNANLTGHVTSVGNAAVLGSFTSAHLLTALTNETGTGVAVFNTSPTLVTPALGTPASGVMTNVSGTAASLTAGAATVLATTRAINGVNFDGSAPITVTAAASTVTGTTLNSTVVTSSLTTVGALDSGSITSNFGSINNGASSITTTGLVSGGDLTLSSANPEILGGDTDGVMYISPSTSTVLGGNIALYGNTHASKAKDIEFRDTAGVELHYDSSGSLWDFQANAVTTTGVITGGGFTGALTGNADTATTLATTRAIAVAGDVTGTANFDGSAAISITTTLATDAIITANITDANVTVAKMAADSVDSDQYVDGSIDTAHIADDQVTLAKMAGGTANSIVSYDGSGDPAELATGISNTNVLVANAAISDDDFLRVDGTSIEGRSASELASDIGASSVGLSVAMAIAL
jgi:hypothetical protein